MLKHGVIVISKVQETEFPEGSQPVTVNVATNVPLPVFIGLRLIVFVFESIVILTSFVSIVED